MIQKELEKWESISSDFELEITESEKVLGHEIKSQLLRFVARGSSVLEAGCGSGHLSIMLAEDETFKASVLDFSETVVGICERNFQRHNVALHNKYVGNLFELGSIVDQKYDVVWNSGVLEHYNDGQIVDALHEMAAASKRLVVTLVPNSSCFLYEVWREHAIRQGQWKWGQEYAKSSMVPYFNAAGIRILSETWCGAAMARDFTYALPGLGGEFRALLEEIGDSPQLEKSAGYLVLTIGEVQGYEREVPYEPRGFRRDRVTDTTFHEFSDRFTYRIKELTATVNEQREEIKELENYVQDKEVYIATLLDERHAARGKSPIRVLKPALRRAKRLAKRVLNLATMHTENPYSRIQYMKNIPVLRFPSIEEPGASVQCSLIATCFNEGEHATAWLQSIVAQTVSPDEIVVVDGGSQDDTVARIQRFADANPRLNIRLICPGRRMNIAEGRNLAIRSAAHNVIIASDFGTTLDDNFVESIIRPFRAGVGVDLAFCRYNVDATNRIQRAFSAHFVPDWGQAASISSFIPSSRAIAFIKERWEESGGYPEWLTRTGEDTLFAIDVRRSSAKWAYCEDTAVHWSFPKSIVQIMRMAYNYGKGDGESGLIGLWNGYVKMNAYRMLQSKLPAASRLPVALLSRRFGGTFTERMVQYQKCKGLLDGHSRRVEILTDRRGLTANVLILSGVPFCDSGGGQRGTQMALEFIARGMKVTFVSVYPSYEAADQQVYFDMDHSLLELDTFDQFSVDDYVARHRSVLARTLVISEFPHPLFYEVLIGLRQSSSAVTIVYDCIDKWDTSLGGDWYSDSAEARIIEQSNALTASATDLQDRLLRITERPVLYLPQGVNARVFNRNRRLVKPVDLPAGTIIMYIGALWGDWFDWSLLKDVCDEFPKAVVVCVGSYKDECPFKGDNIRFVGLKPHYQLPNYLKHADACIIPFKQNDLTQAVNPLKVYEYLAMGKPVVSTNLKELTGLPNVYVSKSKREFITNLRNALDGSSGTAFVDEFISKHSWTSRVDQLMEYVK